MTQAAGQSKQVSPFPSIPDVQPNMGNIISVVQALVQCMRILIVNSQASPQSPNLQGTQIFAKASDIQALTKRIAALEKKIAGM